MSNRKTTIGLAVTAAAALVASGAATASGTPHAPAAQISTPKLVIHESKTTLHVRGPRTFSAGRVDLTLIAKKGEQEVAVARLHKGYTLADANRDFGTFFSSENPTQAGLKALRRIVQHVTFYGGIDTGSGHKTVSGSVVLPKAGTYYILNDDNGPGAVKPVILHVTKRKGNRVEPDSTATVHTRNTKRFAGAKVLPASGTITFHNTATNSPHFLFLQQVKKGTTRNQVRKAIFSNSGPGPILSHGVGTDVVSPGQSMTLSYSLPKGTYAEMCFFPDLQTGMPHAAMGMIRIVTLK